MGAADTTQEKRVAARHVVRTATIAALGGLLFGYDTGVIGSAMLFIKDAFGEPLTGFEQGLIVGAVPVGAVFGAAASGGISDRYGRRRTIMVSALIFIVGTTLSAVAGNVEVLTAGRVMIGVAIGLASAACPVYISEVAPKQLRGRLVTLFQLAVTVGILLAYLVGAAFAASHDWRAMIIVGVTPAVVLAIGMRRMPQSPRWLVMIGEGSEAAATLRYLNPGETEEEIEQDLNEIRAGLSTETGGYSELFTPLVRMALFVGVMLAVLQQITGINTVIYYAPTILQNAGFSSDTTAILAGGGVAVVNVLATIWALKLVQGYGRRTLLMAGVGGMAVALFALGVAFKLDGTTQSIIAIVSLMVFVLSFAISLGPIFWILNSELYPMRVRSKAAGVGTMFNWAFNFIVSLTFLLLIEDLGTSNTFWLYGAISVLTILFVARFVPETKDRSLEEIENDWRKRAGLEELDLRAMASRPAPPGP